jgi:hypothetical protein
LNPIAKNIRPARGELLALVLTTVPPMRACGARCHRSPALTEFPASRQGIVEDNFFRKLDARFRPNHFNIADFSDFSRAALVPERDEFRVVNVIRHCEEPEGRRSNPEQRLWLWIASLRWR